jgi:tRNA splicing ligase
VGPYELTSKENGCIIFIAAVSESALVVTSKHSMADPVDDQTHHAGVAYKWLLKHLELAGRSISELSSWLFKHNATMVTEVYERFGTIAINPCLTNCLVLLVMRRQF